MSLDIQDQASGVSSLHGYLYQPSIASSASPSNVSVFSEPSSTQSSGASSVSDDFRSQEECSNTSCSVQGTTWEAAPKAIGVASLLNASKPFSQALSNGRTSLSSEQRQHPRRCSLARNQRPPPLVRQCERKVNFVDNLVDSATQMVEVIWPLSVVPCTNRSEGNSSSRGVLPLRTYIEETLKRSRTSYSTLQVALYYLILIKPFIPKCDFTMEQRDDCPASRALMCGRRMFLAALILASKYLQDRNYSAKAWSKMSGLKVCEINTNERTFLGKVKWKLHIPDRTFKRWTDIVLQYTPPHHPPPSPDGALAAVNTKPSWKSIVPLLTPELDGIELPIDIVKRNFQGPANYGTLSPSTPTPPRKALDNFHTGSTSQETTPTPITVLPRFLEPKPDLAPPTPALARMGPLPTPLMTPSSVASSTPAVSLASYDSRRPSMCSAMAAAQRAGLYRCMNDQYPAVVNDLERYRMSTHRTSSSRATSPESMISDSSRSSRASSISSISTISTSASAPRPCLARQATCRNVRLPLPQGSKEVEGSDAQRTTVADDTETVSSPDFASFSIREKTSTPVRHKLTTHHTTSVPVSDCRRKRPRSHGGRRHDLQEEVRMLLQEDLQTMDVLDDSDMSSPSSAASCASNMLARDCYEPSMSMSMSMRGIQPAACLTRRDSRRLPVPKDAGKKRTCCSTAAPATMPSSTPPSLHTRRQSPRLFGEMV